MISGVIISCSPFIIGIIYAIIIIHRVTFRECIAGISAVGAGASLGATFSISGAVIGGFVGLLIGIALLALRRKEIKNIIIKE